MLPIFTIKLIYKPTDKWILFCIYSEFEIPNQIYILIILSFSQNKNIIRIRAKKYYNY